jgi:serine/threonine-protein kinase
MTSRPQTTNGDGTSGRYSIFAELACGGMAMVYLGQLDGGHGFKRSVAVKRMHAQFARDPEFRDMFLDEARLVAKIRHPNVVPTLDIVTRDDLLLIVMEFVEGESVLQLLAKTKVPPRIAAAIAHDTLCGLHAAHELSGDDGKSLGVIHRDVSPANILVGKDGLARILDFGVAKASGRAAPTKDGSIKGKVPYMPPEQLWGSDLDRTVDVYATSVVLWEMLTGERLFKGSNDAEAMTRVVEDEVRPPSALVPEAAPLDEVVMRGLSRDPTKRYPTAKDMARALDKALALAPRLEIGDWVAEVAHVSLAKRAELLRGMHRGDPSPAPHDATALATFMTVTTPTRMAVGMAISAPPSTTQAPWRRGLGIASGAALVLALIIVTLGLRTRATTASASAALVEKPPTSAVAEPPPPSFGAAATDVVPPASAPVTRATATAKKPDPRPAKASAPPRSGTRVATPAAPPSAAQPARPGGDHPAPAQGSDPALGIRY